MKLILMYIWKYCQTLLLPFTFLARVPPCALNDWDKNVLAVREEAEVAASVSAKGDSGEE